MNDIRQIVSKHVEDESLRDYFKGKLDSTPPKDKNKILEYLRDRGLIDRDVNDILNAFVEEIQKNSPERKLRKKLAFGYTAITVIVTPSIAYTVNQGWWPAVICISLIFLIIAYFYIHLSE